MTYPCDQCDEWFELNGVTNFLGDLTGSDKCAWSTTITALCDSCYEKHKGSDDE
jgi:hypothetical protein